MFFLETFIFFTLRFVRVNFFGIFTAVSKKGKVVRCFLYGVGDERVAFKIFNGKQTVLIDHEGAGVIFLRQRDRAGIEIGETVSEGRDGEHVGVSVDEHITL